MPAPLPTFAAYTTTALPVYSTVGDLTWGPELPWLVIGWFTPDYRPLAAKFAANLEAVAAPYHLFAKDKRPGGWDTRRKPQVVLEAMIRYPGRTLVLMDVDCIVGGDLSPVVEIPGDVGLSIKARQGKKGRAWQKQIIVTLSSRVMVFRPTPGARQFAAEWADLCERSPTGGDETSLGWAFFRRPDLAFTHLDQRYAGREVGIEHGIDGIVVWHDSAHDRGRWTSIKQGMKQIERRFLRTGATKAEMRQRIG